MLSRVITCISIAVLTAATASAQLSYSVTKGTDSGPGSLRQAILDTNALGPCPKGVRYWIRFPQRDSENVPPLKIQLQSPLPPMTNTSCSVEIGGHAAAPWRLFPEAEISGPGNGLHIHYAADVRVGGIILTGFEGHGLVIEGSSVVDLQSMSVVDNGRNGVLVVGSQSVTLQSVVISGNGANGFYATRSSDLKLNGSRFVNNHANGIHLHDVADVTVIGSDILGNSLTGLLVTGESSPTITRGSFADNGLLGIDIGGDGPNQDRVPVIESARSSLGRLRITGRVRRAPNTRVTISIYASDELDASGFGEGAQFVGTAEVMSDDSGEAVFTMLTDWSFDAVRNRYLSAVATAADGTSEFSRSIAVTLDEPHFTVTSTHDSGPGSLRQTITDVNANELCDVRFPCRITFAIDEGTENGVYTIVPETALPVITASGVWIEGQTQRAFGGDTNPLGPEVAIAGWKCDGCNGLEFRPREGISHQPRNPQLAITDLAVGGFAGDGIAIHGSTIPGTFVHFRATGVYSGIDAAGNSARANGRGLFFDRVSAQVRGSIVSGNRGHGIETTSGDILVEYSRIGTDLTTLIPVGNGGSGLRIGGTSHISGNVIAFNGDRGLSILHPHPRVALNVIHSNGSLGIDIREDGVTTQGAPDVVDLPVITGAHASGDETRITFRASTPPLPFSEPRIEFFAASFTDATGFGEGRTWLGSMHVPPARATEEHEIVIAKNLAGKYISATQMFFYRGVSEAFGPTSEFNRAVQVTTDGCPTLPPQILSAVTENGSTTIRWSALPGATEYRIWVMAPRDEPRIAYQGTDTQVVRSIVAGAEWWIEARFDPCYGTQSEHRFIPD